MRILALHLALLVVAALSGCSAETNILGKTTPPEHLETFENLLDLARAAYDRNDLPKALKYAKKAHDLNEDSEEASLLFGFVNLSLAGGDPFSLAKGLTADAKEKDAAGGGEGGTAGTLTSLKTVLAIRDDELLLMAQKDESDPDLPILVPGCVEDARGVAERLQYLNDAILATCRFIDESAKITDDYRQKCESYAGPHDQPHKAHFLWAFAHLTEALAFNAILTYSTADPTGKQSNLELRAAKIQTIDAAQDLTVFVEAVQSLNKTLRAVLPAGGACSDAAPTTQLRATLNDLLAVDQAFALIPGMPKKITSSLQKAMSRVKGATSASGGDNRAAQAQALKGDFTKKMAKGIAEKIDGLETVTPDQKVAVCAAYDAVAAGSEQTSTLCSGG